MTDAIIVRGARLHNLKNITVSIPRNRLVVLTGLSGSGKSTLGFDILLKEGQRQYMESLGILPFGMARPPVEAIVGLSPTISVDQHLTHQSPRSTVGTVTDVYTYLRVLYARLGRRPCPACGGEVPPESSGSGESWFEDPSEDAQGTELQEFFPCPHCGAAVPVLSMGHFSFNKPEGACPACTGLGTLHQANLARLLDETRSLGDGAVFEWNGLQAAYYTSTLEAAAAHYGLALDLARPVCEFSPALRDLLFFGVEDPRFRRHFPGVAPPATVRRGRFEGLATAVLRRYAGRIQDAEYREKMADYLISTTCPECGGTRLRAESRAVRLGGRSLVEAADLPLTDLAGWLGDLGAGLDAQELRFAAPILDNLALRLAHLVEAGAGYLTLGRAAPSLSAGEAQRLRLAALLGSGLTGMLYVFDEPTIGLHPRDTRRLVGLLRRLRDLGSTVLVIEHDLEMIAAADHVIDMGPGAGKDGGQVVAAGTPAEVAANPASLTGAYLSGRLALPVPSPRRTPGDKSLRLRGARHNNLKNLDVDFPLGLLVAVTGASGSGKSSLVFDTLARTLARRLHGAADLPGEHDSLAGVDALERVIIIDQAHTGRMPRSNAATYSEVFTAIRAAFAESPQARARGLSARHFSFNVPGGRCERCQGMGTLSVSMHFLPDVEVTCPACRGRRFKAETLAVSYRGLDISQVLELTAAEALDLFAEVPAARTRLQVLADVGLGYLQLGQPVTTLSGGEAQRVKLARELGRRASRRTLYLLDEPTTGLHLADTARLLAVLQRLVAGGSSVIVVEHNLDLVKAADWVIDLGPEGGAAGGRLVAVGTPEQVADAAGSLTGAFLKEKLDPAGSG